jgi:replicative DNA helicase
MSIHALCRRMLANHCRFPLGDLRAGRFSEQDMSKFTHFNALLNSSPIFFMDSISGTDSARICGTIRRMVKSEGVKLVVIDYLQKIKEVGNFEKKTYAVGQVSGALMAIAKETGCALLTLAQLNRESVKEKTPRLPRISDLADSGQIERDADCIGLLHRDRDTNGGRDAVLIVAKQRDGDVGNCEMSFEGQFSVFENRRIETPDIPQSYIP